MILTSELEKIYEQNKERYIREWFELLSFPSISTSETNAKDCTDCAEWLVQHLNNMGFKTRLLDSTSRPVVFAERIGNPDKPTVLFYGHYDVQPVDPVDAWTTPPFKPSLRDGRIYARGAQDNKGQLFHTLKAIEALTSINALDPTVKIILEGEEESGSKVISDGLQKWKDILSADILMVADTNMVNNDTPTIIMGLRGMAYLTATLSGPDHDLHSGVHGGTAPNPAQGIARLINSLHNDDGSIAVPGFYDAVTEPTDKERDLANATPIDPQTYEAETGAPPLAGEMQFTPVERNGFRPSIDINGITSGYSGQGVKTIIPANASAKITARLVPDQIPEKSLQQIINHLKAHVPAGMKLTISDEGSSGPGFRLNPDSPLTQKTISVLAKLSKNKPAFLWEGASIPIIAGLSQTSGAEPLLVGFGQEKDNIHAPNESFSLDQFKLGFLYSALMLGSL